MNDTYHKSVLLQETIDFLRVSSGEKYIDATAGGGGHIEEILKRGGTVLGIDLDRDAIEHVKKRLKDYKNLYLSQGNYRDIDEIAKEYGFLEVSGIVMDLGLSSHQIDDSTRGFSYLGNNALDMRMDRKLGVKASDLLNVLRKDDLYEIFSKYGQEPRSSAISNSIVGARRIKAFETTRDLTDIVERVYKMKGEINPKMKAKINSRVFQALRIAVNEELVSLSDGLPKAFSLLKHGGRLAVISFHSLEDKIVKDAFKGFEASGVGILVNQKPITPSFAEISDNRRSRSAKLRVIEKI